MKIKGHTLIELKNKRTGEVRRIEKDNMLTQAILKLWANPWGLNNYPQSPAQLMSGILLFENAQDPQVSNVKLTEMPATWAGNGENTTAATTYGSMNRAECEQTANTVKFVWNWTEEQGNGTYRSAALTSPLLCNDAKYGLWTRNGANNTDPHGRYPYENKNLIHGYAYGTAMLDERWRPLTPPSGTAENPFAQPFCYDNVNGYLYGMTSSDGQTLKITRTFCPADGAYLTQGQDWNYTDVGPDFPRLITESKTITLDTIIYNTLVNASARRCMAYCAGDNGVIVIVTLSGYSTTGGTSLMTTLINFNSGTAVQSSFTLDYVVRMPNSYPYQWCNAYPVKHPYIYVPGTGTTPTWYKINVLTGAQEPLLHLASGNNVTQLNHGYINADPLYYVWTDTASGVRKGSMINTLDDTIDCSIIYPEEPTNTPADSFTYSESRLGGKGTTVIPNDLQRIYLWCGSRDKTLTSTNRGCASLEINPCYKATINNFDRPIVKTSADTMKITYTLTQM